MLMVTSVLATWAENSLVGVMSHSILRSHGLTFRARTLKS